MVCHPAVGQLHGSTGRREMNQAHRRHEVLRLMGTIGIKRAEYNHDARLGCLEKPECYETMGLQQRLNRLMKLAKESHAQK